MKSLNKRPIIGVMGSGKEFDPISVDQLGYWLAGIGVHLLTGGGKGVMEGISQSFAANSDRKGLIIGVIPGRYAEETKKYARPHGYPNRWVEIAISTHLPWSGSKGTNVRSRNHINILSSDAVILLPGEKGTAAEAELAIRYEKPVVAWLQDRSQIPGLNPRVPVVLEFEKVKDFVMFQIQLKNG